MQFRPDIEGLRALAILLVVAVHAGLPWLPGGFMGVDVFFVVSGYLITCILADELKRTGTIQFGRFYARRFRRLLPALLLMICVTALLGWQLLPATRQGEQASTAMTAALWISNFRFAFERLNYFDPAASENLYLHTWSLGVEEQFYLVWPVLLMLGFGAWRVRIQPDMGGVGRMLCLIAGTSFIACVAITSMEPRHAFYLMPMRAWQFAVGGLAGLAFTARTTHSTVPRRWYGWLGWCGLGVIVASAVALGPHITYPGAWALLPSVGTVAVLIACGRAKDASVARFLSLPAMTAIGRVSYSWYLWHWPVLLLGAVLIPSPSVTARAGLVALSLAVAWLSYHFVEAPIRKNAGLVLRPRYTVLAALALMACTSAAATRWNIDAERTLASPAYLRTVKARFDKPIIYRMGCDQWFDSAALTPCILGNPNASRTVVVLGDSVGLQWFPAIEAAFQPDEWRIVVMTKSACPMVDLPIFYPRIGRMYTECETWRATALARIRELAPERVIVGSSYTYDFSPKQWREGTVRLLRHIVQSAGGIHILRATPTLPFDGPGCAAPRGKLWHMITNASCTAPAHNPGSDAVFQSLQAAASSFKNVNVIDLTDVVCPANQCSAERNGMLTYRDSQHLAASFVVTLAPDMARRLELQQNMRQDRNEER